MLIQELPPTIGLIQCPRVQIGKSRSKRLYYAGIGPDATPWTIGQLEDGLVSVVFFKKQADGHLIIDRLIYNPKTGRQESGEKFYREDFAQSTSFSVVAMPQHEKRKYQEALKTLLAFSQYHRLATIPESNIPATYKKFLDDLDKFKNVVPAHESSLAFVHCMGRWHPANSHGLCEIGC